MKRFLALCVLVSALSLSVMAGDTNGPPCTENCEPPPPCQQNCTESGVAHQSPASQVALAVLLFLFGPR